MIQREMKPYNVFGFGPPDDYGQRLPNQLIGLIQLSITKVNENVIGGIQYKDASYIGLTNDNRVTEATAIRYKEELLKVQNVVNGGRYLQVFLKEM